VGHGAGGAIALPLTITCQALAGRELGDVIDEIASTTVRGTRGAWGVLTRDLVGRRTPSSSRSSLRSRRFTIQRFTKADLQSPPATCPHDNAARNIPGHSGDIGIRRRAKSNRSRRWENAMSVAITRIWLAGALFATAWTYDQSARSLQAQAPTRKSTVVVELFTSEGCSSCPPADRVLSELVHRQPLPGVEVLALGEHVDYWDRLGWRDPFSSAMFSTRQSNYSAGVFHNRVIYTPQLVIDGQLETVGSDSAAVRRAIEEAARAPKAAVGVVAERAADRRELHVEVPPNLALHDAADVVVAVTEDNLSTDVRRGENGGRTLTHSAVVRSLTTVGALPRNGGAWLTSVSVPLAPEWKPESLRVIGFVQEHQHRRILGAGASSLKGTPR
jgi:hypothetical protein